MKKILITLSLIIILTSTAYALPAFPGAEGMGASSMGARGYSGTPTVVKVINLEDSGAGSFREAVEGAGKDGRYVVFETSGIISLLTPVRIKSNFITIAGETSPGGICIAGDETSIGDDNDYNIHDIIIRNIRFREGSQNCAPDCDDTHAFTIWKSYNIIIDHCSFSWGVDETVSVTTYKNAPAYDITFSYCVFAEGLTDPAPESNHGYLFLFNGTYHTDNRLSLHHNFFTSANGRMPQFSGAGLCDFRNNIIYNWDRSQNTMIIPYTTGQLNVNYIGNYQKAGPESNACNTNSYDATSQGGVTSGCPDSGSITPYAMVYMEDNFGCRRTTGTEPDWQLGCGWSGDLMSTSWQQPTAFATTDIPVTTTAMTTAYADAVLSDVGATKPFRDSQDAKNIEEYGSGTGSLKTDTTWPDDWPAYTTHTPPDDSDHDGMSDVWEVATYGDLTQTATGDYNSDGYDNIETYFHSLAGAAPTPAPSVPKKPTGLSGSMGRSIK